MKHEVCGKDLESDNNVVLGTIETVPSQEPLQNDAQSAQCEYKTQHTAGVKDPSLNTSGDDDPTQSVSDGEQDPGSPKCDAPTETVGDHEQDPGSPQCDDPTQSVSDG